MWHDGMKEDGEKVMIGLATSVGSKHACVSLCAHRLITTTKLVGEGMLMHDNRNHSLSTKLVFIRNNH